MSDRPLLNLTTLEFADAVSTLIEIVIAGLGILLFFFRKLLPLLLEDAERAEHAKIYFVKPNRETLLQSK